VVNINGVPVEWGWVVLGLFLFGLLLPMLTAQRLLVIWRSLKTDRSGGDQKKEFGVVKTLLLGWLALIPVYFWSSYYINAQLISAVHH